MLKEETILYLWFFNNGCEKEFILKQKKHHVMSTQVRISHSRIVI